MSVRVTGRVISVKPLEDGTRFSVTVGPPPELFWFETRRPPRLGARVRVTGSVRTKQELGGAAGGSVSVLSSARWKAVDHSHPARPVPQTWLRRVQEVMGRPLYRYQVEGAGWICSRLSQRRGAILGDDPGLGKTAQAVAAAVALGRYPVVVVCPASLKQHWVREFAEAREPPVMFVAEGRYGPMGPGQVFILNYELLWPREKQLLELKPSLYIFDEAQYLKEPEARGKHRAAVATRLVRHTGGALELTGTPIMNRPAELWRLLHLSEPNRWPSFEEYRDRYLTPKKGKEVGRHVRTKAGRIERLDELQATVAPAMLRRLKMQVLPELPPKHRRSLLVDLGQQYMTHYRVAEHNVIKWLSAMGQDARAVRAARAEGLVRLTMLRHIAAVGKLAHAVPSYLGRWYGQPNPEPLVIFAYHRDVIVGLWNICRQLRSRVAGIGGGEGMAKRQRQIDSFQNGEADAFIAPIASAGVGLNLQRSNEALFVERIWTPSGMVQAEDRIHRLGQQRPCTITYLDARGTVDEYIATVLEQKQALIAATVDSSDPVTESVETANQVMAGLRDDE